MKRGYKNVYFLCPLFYNLDKEYMQKIERNDRYRVEKAYSIYKQSGLPPTLYFEQNPKIPIAKNLKIFEIYN